MVRIKHSRKENPNPNLPPSVMVFDEDDKKVYFHDGSDVPDFMDKKEFYKNYKEDH